MENRYTIRYNKLIHHFRMTVPESGFFERHHILPLCMGGSNGADNLVLLPTKAHFLAHFLLHRAYPENRKLAHAFAMMIVQKKGQNRKVTARMYEAAKLARSGALKNVPLSEEVKAKMRKPKLNKENYSKPKTSEHAAKIGDSLRGRKKSPEHIARSVATKKKNRLEKNSKAARLAAEARSR